MKKLATVLLLNLGIVGGMTNVAQAENAATAPAELTAIIAGIEKAANNQDLDGVIGYYSQDFKHSDGLTTEAVSKALAQMWKNYPQLKYTTEIESWSASGNELVAETMTTVRGIQNQGGRQERLNSTIKSRQYFQGQKLVRQEILTEESQLTSGEHPPQVKVVAPSTVTTGEKYNFDLIVDEPLGDQVLLGAVQEEKTAANLYLNSTSLELKPLAAGGIYKVATAPALPESNWLSAILVRGDGITVITHRVNIQEGATKP
ncbi:MAG: nuclear transport factor 2 family protein [Hydrococcus sp. SU_1_0]|nr:nuclear transport factor 2 family protein [Hydrococcus sp. SU_1_0]